MIDISGWRKRQIALDQKAENARDLGLDYAWVGLTQEEFIHYSSLAHFDVVDAIENLLKEKNMTSWKKRGGDRG
jgi:hypothetical protein